MVDSLEEFEVSRGFRPGELAPYDFEFEEGHIIIPVKGRAGDWYKRTRCDQGCHPKYQSPQGAENHLYNPLGLGPHSSDVWFTEGELDCLTCIVSGVPAVGILGASSFREAWKRLFEAANIVIAFDSDEAGNRAAETLAGLFGGWSERVSRFDPSPFGDLNEWFTAHRESFTEAVNEW